MATGREELSNDLVDAGRLESMIFAGFICGASMLAVHRAFVGSAKQAGGRIEKVFVELQRKSFHMIGGCIICSVYHWGIKHGLLTSACRSAGASTASASSYAMDGGAAFLSLSLVSWLLEASRLMFPAVQRWYMESFSGLVREKERAKAAGIAYFLPGALAAMLAAPSNVAVLGILLQHPRGLLLAEGGGQRRVLPGGLAMAVFAGLPVGVSLVTCTLVTLGEVLAEVIGLDDNFVIPLLGVLGVRIGIYPQLGHMLAVMCIGLGVGAGLGAVVSASKASKKDSNGRK
eukprot:CAMPEP_0171201658 /NCGR_PEP_ID=MMETSP0790-20130122/24602_1 /TAXON_ID=2925 /ORGANISM="Alexandrium catenella, Strain OF101" /LENGTH=287 /DNA_ID=CAMNT_0011667061 /DNA_START=89 /DNA_END=953 /DNA_ORIENTATION=-